MRTLLVLLLGIVSIVSSAKIAVFFAPFSNSQVVFNIRFAEELAKDHEVVLIRPRINPKSDKLVSTHPKVREIRTIGCTEETFRAYQEAQHGWVYGPATFTVAMNVSKSYRNLFRETCKNMVNDADFIAKLRAEKFDFAFTHHADLCPIGIIHAAGNPHWGWTLSTPPFTTVLSRVGMPILPSIVPGLVMDAPHTMTFWQRFKNFFMEVSFEILFGTFATSAHTQSMRDALGEDFPHLRDLMEKASLMVVNSHADIEFPVPVTSKVVFIGGLAQKTEVKPLQEPFKFFIGNASKVVLVSFGTVAESSTMPQHWKDSFVELFRQNPSINFIWKMDSEVEVPSNVMRVKWQPQNDILANEKTVAFITHAGYNSIGEAIGSGTPLVTIPLFGDQHRNSQLTMFRHLGVRVDKDKIAFETLNEALHKLIDDPSYLASAKELLQIQNSSPLSPGMVLRSAVNFTLNHPNFDRELPRLPMYQLYSLDCMALIISIVFVVLYIVYRVMKLAFHCCRLVVRRKEKVQ